MFFQKRAVKKRKKDLPPPNPKKTIKIPLKEILKTKILKKKFLGGGDPGPFFFKVFFLKRGIF